MKGLPELICMTAKQHKDNIGKIKEDKLERGGNIGNAGKRTHEAVK